MLEGCITFSWLVVFQQQEQALEVEAEWKKRGKVPQYVFDAIRALPR